MRRYYHRSKERVVGYDKTKKETNVKFKLSDESQILMKINEKNILTNYRIENKKKRSCKRWQFK